MSIGGDRTLLVGKSHLPKSTLNSMVAMVELQGSADEWAVRVRLGPNKVHDAVQADAKEESFSLTWNVTVSECGTATSIRHDDLWMRLRQKQTSQSERRQRLGTLPSG